MIYFQETTHDVLMVCTNGHVVTDRLRTQPERHLRHCDRCGAATQFRCETCGTEMSGAMAGIDLLTVGQRQPPHFCSTCGAAFPWAKKPALPKSDLWPALETMLRRLPRTVHELKLQAGARPPFRLDDERDLEYLLRGLLPLCCDEIHLESRTPGYSLFNRTDFVLLPEQIALTVKLASEAGCEDEITHQLQEDLVYYRKQKDRRLLVLVFDAAGLLAEPELLEGMWTRLGSESEVKVIIAR